ncbi:hypothetical protein BSLG_004011 [Batrachochytrium salamandrivorans]|nr:hypothetical protein BSLG_004011 [Batrachochytrium salamandrivorans]
MELTLVGLQNSGKTTLVSVIANGQFRRFNPHSGFQYAIPEHVGDIAERVNAIVYVVDSADHAKIESAKTELHTLLERPLLAGISACFRKQERSIRSLTVEDLISSLASKHYQSLGLMLLYSAKNSTNMTLLSNG